MFWLDVFNLALNLVCGGFFNVKERFLVYFPLSWTLMVHKNYGRQWLGFISNFCRQDFPQRQRTSRISTKEELKVCSPWGLANVTPLPSVDVPSVEIFQWNPGNSFLLINSTSILIQFSETYFHINKTGLCFVNTDTIENTEHIKYSIEMPFGGGLETFCLECFSVQSIPPLLFGFPHFVLLSYLKDVMGLKEPWSPW